MITMFGRSGQDVPMELPGALGRQVDTLLAAGKYYDAIKVVRKATGASLVMGKHAVDHRQELLER